MNYSFGISLNVHPALAALNQFQQRFDGSLSQMQQLTNRFAAGFERRFQGMVRSASQSIDQLKVKLNNLGQRREISIDSSQIARAQREAVDLDRRLRRLRSANVLGAGRVGAGQGRSSPIGAGVASTAAIASGVAAGAGGGIMAAAKSVLPALGLAAIISAAGSFISSGMEAEQTRMAYRQFAGDQADPLYEKLNTFANKTSFSNKEILAGGRTMLASGYTSDEIVPMSNTIGNIAAGANKNYGDLVGAVAKIKQKGFIDGGELHEEFGGTPLMETLMKNLGVDGETLFKMAEKHQIKYSDLVKAMVDMTTGKGVFAGYLEKDMNTTKGKLSTFLGTFLFDMSRLAEALNPVIGLLLDVGSGLLAAFDPVFTALMNLFKAFEPLFSAIGTLLGLLGIGGQQAGLLTVIMNMLAFAINAVAVIVQLLSSAIQYLVDNPIMLFLTTAALVILNLGTIVGWVVTLIGWVSTAFTWVIALAESFWAFTTAMLACPAVWIIAAIAAIVAGVLWLWDNCEGFRHGLIKLWEVAKAVFGSIGKAWNALMKGDFSGVGKAFAEGIKKGLANADVKIAADKASRAAGSGPKVPKAPAATKPAMPAAPGAGGPGGGGKPGVGKAAGLDSTTGGTKSTNITINLQTLVGTINIKSETMGMAMEEVRNTVTDELLRVLNSANSIAT